MTQSTPALKTMVIVAAKNVSGPVKGVFQLFKHVDSNSVDLKLYGFQYRDSRTEPFLRAAFDNGIRIRCLFHDRWSYFGLVRQVLREVRGGEFDVIQSHGYLPTFLAFFARLFCRVKWICFMHGTTTENLKVRIYNLVDNLLQLAADRTVLVSNAQRTRIFGGRNPLRVHVLHNAVDIHNPMPRATAAASIRGVFGIPGDGQIVVSVGRLSPEKGIDVLLDAFSILRSQLGDVHLVVVGEGHERDRLETQCHELHIGECVHFAGHTETPGDIVAEADVVALPSRSEGIPNVVLEAMAMGKPVVATAVGGVPEIMEDHISGRLVPSGRPDLLAQALAELLVNKRLSECLGIRGQSRVRSAFSVESRVADFQSLYQSLR